MDKAASRIRLPKGLQLEGKSGLFARKCKFFEKQKIAC